MARRGTSGSRSAAGGGKKSSGPQRIDNLLSGLMARRGYAQVQQSAELEAAWSDAAGASLAPVSRPAEIRRGVLEVIVENSAAAQELMFQKSEILEKLTRTGAGQQVKDLRLRIGVV